jgi:glutamine amidotransferase
MCRLFAALAAPGQEEAVHVSLLAFFNGLAEGNHAGWGLARFEEGRAFLHKEPVDARLSKTMAAEVAKTGAGVVIGHLRKMSVGAQTWENTHPFAYEGWSFAHNGTWAGYRDVRDRLPREHRLSLQGNSDSEVLFHYILQNMELEGDEVKGIRKAVADIDKDRRPGTTCLNFVLARQERFYALRYAFINEPKYSLHVRAHGDAHPVVVCSEPLDEGAWPPLRNRELLVIDDDGSRSFLLD